MNKIYILCSCSLHLNFNVYSFLSFLSLSIYLGRFPQFWGGSRQHERNDKNNGDFTPFFRQCRGTQPSLDGTAGATQPIPPPLPCLPQLTCKNESTIFTYLQVNLHFPRGLLIRRRKGALSHGSCLTPRPYWNHPRVRNHSTGFSVPQTKGQQIVMS